MGHLKAGAFLLHHIPFPSHHTKGHRTGWAGGPRNLSPNPDVQAPTWLPDQPRVSFSSRGTLSCFLSFSRRTTGEHETSMNLLSRVLALPATSCVTVASSTPSPTLAVSLSLPLDLLELGSWLPQGHASLSACDPLAGGRCLSALWAEALPS